MIKKDNTTTTPHLLWKLKNISINGPQGARLKELSLELLSGKTAIIGPSGAGKSSLLNLLVEFETIDTGIIHISDDAVPFYWVPQNHGLWPNLNVKEHLRTMMQKPDNNRIDEIMRKFDISHKEQAYPAHLSKGEQSRLAMARALVVPPKVLIMDEPLINLPPSKQMHYWKVVTELAEKYSISLIYATHSPKYVIGTADRVICLKDSQLLYSGSVEKLYHSPGSFELAEYLGDINWFTEENKIFTQALSNISFPFGIRPEEILLKPASNGKLKVVRSIFRGDITETTLRLVADGEEISILHRTPISLKIGDFCTLILNKRKKI